MGQSSRPFDGPLHLSITRQRAGQPVPFFDGLSLEEFHVCGSGVNWVEGVAFGSIIEVGFEVGCFDCANWETIVF